jgi:hypothetical protein
VCSPGEACLKTGFDEYTTCGRGYSGLMCAACAKNFYKFYGTCKDCPSETIKALTIVAAVLLLSILLWRIMDRRTQIPTDVRLVVQTLQLIALFPNISVKWPKFLLTLFQLTSIFVSTFIIELFSLTKSPRTLTLRCSLQNVLSKSHFGISTTSNL